MDVEKQESRQIGVTGRLAARPLTVQEPDSASLHVRGLSAVEYLVLLLLILSNPSPVITIGM